MHNHVQSNTLTLVISPKIATSTNTLKPNSTSMYVKIYCSSSIDDISRRVQDLVEKINNSRTSDQKVMDSFQQKLVDKV